MPYSIEFTEKAASDLENKMEQLESYDESAVIRFEGKLMKKLDQISIFPRSAPQLNEENIDREMRFVVVDRYIFVYCIDESNDIVTIMRIFDDNHDWQSFT